MTTFKIGHRKIQRAAFPPGPDTRTDALTSCGRAAAAASGSGSHGRPRTELPLSPFPRNAPPDRLRLTTDRRRACVVLPASHAPRAVRARSVGVSGLLPPPCSSWHYRVILRQCSTAVAFGEKRTLHRQAKPAESVENEHRRTIPLSDLDASYAVMEMWSSATEGTEAKGEVSARLLDSRRRVPLR